MDQAERLHVLKSVLVLLAVFLAARQAGWLGPGARIALMTEVMFPGAIVIAFWGLYRLACRAGRSRR